MDAAHAHRETETEKATLEEARSNMDTYSAHVYAQATALAQCWDPESDTPSSKSTAKSTECSLSRLLRLLDHLNLTIPLLDHLITEHNAQFDGVISAYY